VSGDQEDSWAAGVIPGSDPEKKQQLEKVSFMIIQ
jgi:hypothetical protein